jgi:hypothetical protein
LASHISVSKILPQSHLTRSNKSPIPSMNHPKAHSNKNNSSHFPPPLPSNNDPPKALNSHGLKSTKNSNPTH